MNIAEAFKKIKENGWEFRLLEPLNPEDRIEKLKELLPETRSWSRSSIRGLLAVIMRDCIDVR